MRNLTTAAIELSIPNQEIFSSVGGPPSHNISLPDLIFTLFQLVRPVIITCMDFCSIQMLIPPVNKHVKSKRVRKIKLKTSIKLNWSQSISNKIKILWQTWSKQLIRSLFLLSVVVFFFTETNFTVGKQKVAFVERKKTFIVVCDGQCQILMPSPSQLSGLPLKLEENNTSNKH